MSLLPHTLLNATSNEDQTLEIHSEILEPLAHSQNITRWEIPHKNVLDSDSQLIWKVFWDGMKNGADPDFSVSDGCSALPFHDAGLISTLSRARLYVDGVIISELNEVGKFLTLKNNFRPHEVKVEKHDLFTYADHNIENVSGQIAPKIAKIRKSTGDRSLGREDLDYQVECSVRLGDIFGILEGAQLDTNSIMGKIMLEIDWNAKNVLNNVSYIGTALQTVGNARGIRIADPRLLLDFLTYNHEVMSSIKGSVFGDGPGINMPFKEVALVRKTINSGSTVNENSEDFFIGMTGRAVQKIWLQKVNQRTDLTQQTDNNLMGENRSDLLLGQRWNCKINDLMIFDRDVKSRAEEFNYVEQGGEGQFTCEPGSYEQRACDEALNATDADASKRTPTRVGYKDTNDLMVLDCDGLFVNTTTAGASSVGLDNPYTRYPIDTNGANGQGQYKALQGGAIRLGIGDGGTGQQKQTVSNKLMGRKNYLCIPCGKYGSAGTSSASAIRVGSTPIIFTLQYTAGSDKNTTAQPGTAFFFVEYLKMMNLKNGEIRVMDL